MVHLGNNINSLFEIVSGKHPFVKTVENFLKKDNNNQKVDNNLKNKSKIIQALQTNKLVNAKFNINIIDSSVGNINSKELGLFSNKKNYKRGSNLYYLLGSETIKGLNENDLVIYQGTHNEKIRTKFDVILPTLN
jgi:hypothetical protein